MMLTIDGPAHCEDFGVKMVRDMVARVSTSITMGDSTASIMEFAYCAGNVNIDARALISHS